MKIKLDPYAIKPTRSHDTDAGLDLYCPKTDILRARDSLKVYTGVHVELPKDCGGLLVSKSGLYTRHGISSTGLIDEGFTGEIVVRLENHSNQDYLINRGDRVTQLVVFPVRYEAVEIVDEIEGSERGEDGFGSTGK